MKGSSSSDNQTPTKCFSGILRGLLCTGSLPTHPSDQFNIESKKTQIDCRNPGKSSQSEANHVNKQADASSKPGEVDNPEKCGEDQLQLVARKTSVIYEKKKMEKRVRAKSRNGEKFIERTVNKKLSAGRSMETGEGRRSVYAKSQSGLATPKKDFNGRTSVDLKERKAVINKPAIDSRERRPTTKQVKKKKVHGVKKMHPEPTGKREASHEVCSNKHTSYGEIRAITKSKTREKKARNECTNVLEEVFRLTQESVDEIDCDWTDGKILKFEDFEADICVQFGGQILEVLLIQIVHELVLLYGTWN